VHLAEIWRYPVKSMAGELLNEIELGRNGIPGDRVVQVRQPREPPREGERIVSARRRPALLAHRGTLGSDGEPRVDGRPWTDPDVAADIVAAAGAGSYLVRSDEPEDRFDVLPLLVVFAGTVDAMGFDRRRFRPNLVLAGTVPHAERGWEERRLRVGEAVLQLADLRERCVMTTYDPETQAQDPGVLRRIVEELGGVLGLNTEVIRPGLVRAGDPVELD